MFPWIERHRELSKPKEPITPQPAPWPQPEAPREPEPEHKPEPEPIKEDSFPADEAEIIISEDQPEEEEEK